MFVPTSQWKLNLNIIIYGLNRSPENIIQQYLKIVDEQLESLIVSDQ